MNAFLEFRMLFSLTQYASRNQPFPPKPLPGAAYNGNRGKQVTMKGISRVAVSQPSWWDASEDSPQGVLL